MNILKWIFEMFAALIGAAGIVMIACGLWFTHAFVNSMIYGHGEYGLIVIVGSIGALIIGAGLLLLARFVSRKADNYQQLPPDDQTPNN